MPVAPLGSVIDFIRGITFKPEDLIAPAEVDAVVCMRTKNIQQTLDESDLIAVPSRFVRRDELFLRPGDQLISSANSWELVGKVVYVNELAYPATAGGFISIVRPHLDSIDSRYLFQWLREPKTQAAIRNCGRQTTNISNLSVERFLELELPLPPLNEQRRLAAILDKADAIRRKRREALKLADDFLRAAFLELFGDSTSNPHHWSTNPLRDFVVSGDKINYGVVQPGDAVTEGIPLVRVADLEEIEIRPEVLKRISPDIESQYRRSRLFGDEILVACVGSIGKVAEASPLLADCNIARAVARIRPHSGIRREYLVAYLRSSHIQNYFSRETRTVSQPTLNISLIEATPVVEPPLAMQNRYAAIASRTTLLKGRLRSALAESEQIFSSLSHRAFQGTL